MHTHLKPFKLAIIALLLPLILGIRGCDKEQKNECEWYIMPDDSPKRIVDEGFIPVCARNLVIVKENCRLQMEFEAAKSAYGKKFKYNDLKIKPGTNAYTIEKAKACKD